jgi:hypothetical protein
MRNRRSSSPLSCLDIQRWVRRDFGKCNVTPEGIGRRAARAKCAALQLRARQTGRQSTYLSGKNPPAEDGCTPRAKLGAGITVEESYRHADRVGLVLIAR